MSMVPVNRCLQGIISADVTKITQGTTAKKVSVLCSINKDKKLYDLVYFYVLM